MGLLTSYACALFALQLIQLPGKSDLNTRKIFCWLSLIHVLRVQE